MLSGGGQPAGASGGAALGPLLFGLTVEATNFGTAWIATAVVALLAAAAILAGRRLLLRDLAATRGQSGEAGTGG